MKIAVCDDDTQCRKYISALLNKYCQIYPQYNITVFLYEHADDLISAAKKNGGFDIYVLDILMPDTNGVELGVTLRKDGYDGKIIYLTSSDEYVFDAFKANPFNYIIKPIEVDKLFPVLTLAINTLEYKKEKSIIVKTSDGNIKLSLDSIMYTELQNRCMIFHLTNGRTVESTTIRSSFSVAAKELIEDEHFLMCGASLIVNLLHITTSKTQEIVFRDGSSIQLSRKLLTELRSKWYEYWLGSRESEH